MKYKKPMIGAIIVLAVLVLGLAVVLGTNGEENSPAPESGGKSRPVTDVDVTALSGDRAIDEIKIVLASGSPNYEVTNKIITDENEIENFIEIFENALIDKEAQVDVPISLTSYYRFYSNGEQLAEYTFNGIDTNIMWTGQELEAITFEDKTPYELYQNSKSPELIFVEVEGKETEVVRYIDKLYVKSELSQDTIEWLEWFNSLDQDEQLSISSTPNFSDAQPLGGNEITDTTVTKNAETD